MSRASPRILVVEDNDALRRGIVAGLSESWGEIEQVDSGELAMTRIRDPHVPSCDVVVTDLRLPRADGIDVLAAAREHDERTAVILMTAYGTIETAVEAMRKGAFDFLQKPFDIEQLDVRVARAVETSRLRREVGHLRASIEERYDAGNIVGGSPALRRAVELAVRVAPTRSTVLITGETGTGKELIAGLVHARSSRSNGPFVKVNCAALPETLLESELFGHERGAFTGADRQRIGRFEEANGGTLFLDEIGDMSPATQAKLLRVLQDQEFYRLGGTRPLRTDVRIVAATNQRLEEAIREGRFREDLFFRLNVIAVHLPPLRERPEDAVALSEHFLQRFRAEMGRPATQFSDEARASFESYAWPGNVRELRNAVERAVLMADGPRISARDLGLSAMEGSARPLLPVGGMPLRDLERQIVVEALERSGYVQKDAAGLLHVSRRKLNYMIQRMGITHPSWRRNRVSADERAKSD